MSGKKKSGKKEQWPKTVPILGAGNIHKGALSDGKGRYCMVGWLDEVFGVHGFYDCDDLLQITDRKKRAEGAVMESLSEVSRSVNIVTFNDNPRVKKSKIAKVWNRAMALLGYVVGNPEAKWLEKRLETRLKKQKVTR